MAGICNVLPRPVYSNGLIVVKLKRDHTYRGYVYFEPAAFPYCHLFLNTDNNDKKHAKEKLFVQKKKILYICFVPLNIYFLQLLINFELDVLAFLNDPNDF